MRQPCSQEDTTRVTSPNGAFWWLQAKPLNAATGRVLAPYRPGVHHGRRHHHRTIKTQRHSYILASSDCCTFFCISGPEKWTLHSAHRSDELCRWKGGHACRARAQLVGVTLYGLRGPKLTEILIFFQKLKNKGD